MTRVCCVFCGQGEAKGTRSVEGGASGAGRGETRAPSSSTRRFERPKSFSSGSETSSESSGALPEFLRSKVARISRCGGEVGTKRTSRSSFRTRKPGPSGTAQAAHNERPASRSAREIELCFNDGIVAKTKKKIATEVPASAEAKAAGEDTVQKEEEARKRGRERGARRRRLEQRQRERFVLPIESGGPWDENKKQRRSLSARRAWRAISH